MVLQYYCIDGIAILLYWWNCNIIVLMVLQYYCIDGIAILLYWWNCNITVLQYYCIDGIAILLYWWNCNIIVLMELQYYCIAILLYWWYCNITVLMELQYYCIDGIAILLYWWYCNITVLQYYCIDGIAILLYWWNCNIRKLVMPAAAPYTSPVTTGELLFLCKSEQGNTTWTSLSQEWEMEKELLRWDSEPTYPLSYEGSSARTQQEEWTRPTPLTPNNNSLSLQATKTCILISSNWTSTAKFCHHPTGRLWETQEQWKTWHNVIVVVSSTSLPRGTKRPQLELMRLLHSGLRVNNHWLPGATLIINSCFYNTGTQVCRTDV